MLLSPEVVRLSCCALGAAALGLIFISRITRSIERRVFTLLLSILLITLGFLLVIWFVYHISPEAVLAVILVELGIFAYVYDSYRPYRSLSRNLRNMGSIYVFIGLCLLLSLAANFPTWAWIIPVVLLFLGYFFLRRKKGLANFCKGAGILVSVAFIASMIYDVREGNVSRRSSIPLSERLLPEIVKPSIVEDLNALNEKVRGLEELNARLSKELLARRADCTELSAKLEIESGKLKDAELKQREAEQKQLELARAKADALDKLKDSEKAKAAVEIKLAETEKAKTAAEAEYEKAKTTGKQSFSKFEEQLNKAVEDLTKAVKERDEIKAELDALKSAPTPAPAPGIVENLESEVQSLKQKLAEKEKEKAQTSAELERLKKILEKVKEALVTVQ